MRQGDSAGTAPWVSDSRRPVSPISDQLADHEVNACVDGRGARPWRAHGGAVSYAVGSGERRRIGYATRIGGNRERKEARWAVASTHRNVRASDAEREAVVERLRRALSQGRLSIAEFDDRVSVAYAARTQGELADLTRDLPGSLW